MATTKKATATKKVAPKATTAKPAKKAAPVKATKATTVKTAPKAAPVEATTVKQVEVKKSWIQTYWSTLVWIAVALGFLACYITLVYWSVHKSSIDGYSEGTKFLKPDANGKTPDGTWGTLPKGYLATFILGIVFAILVIIGLGGWLRGSKWINRSNPYVKGQVYIRTNLQTFVFRAATLVIAGILLWSFTLDSFFSDVKGRASRNPIHQNFTQDGSSWRATEDHSASNIVYSYFNYFVTNVDAWYYQCFITSFIMGWIIVFKKYNWVKIVFPMGFIGAVRTFGDITDWFDDDSGWDVPVFVRLVIEHLVLIFGPLFIIVANRDRYRLVNIKATFAYTFILVFIPYVLYSMSALWNKGKYDVGGFGEIKGVVEWWKLGGDNAGQWTNENLHLFFWCMYVPFGLAIVILIIFFVNLFTWKAEAEGNWGQRWANVWKEYGHDVKVNQWPVFLASFSNLTTVFRPKREKPIPFGVDPKVWEARKRK